MDDQFNQLAELLLANVTAGAWLQDGAGRCLWANAALLRLLGRAPEDLWPADIAQTLAATGAQVRDANAARTLRIELADARSLEIELHPLTGAGPAQIAGLVRDVTGQPPPPVAPAPPVVFDATVLRDWIDNDAALLPELIKSYLDDAASRLPLIESALQAGDAKAATMEAHSLKGSSATTGMLEMKHLSAQLEDLARHDNLAAARAVGPLLRAALERVRALSQPAASPDPAVLDPATTARLRELASANAPAFMSELYQAFLTSAGIYLARLQAAVAAGQAEGVRQAAHALGGASANIGATTLAGLCRQLETRGTAGRVDGDVTGVERELARVKIEIENQTAKDAS